MVEKEPACRVGWEHLIFVIPLTPSPSPTWGEGRILYFSPLSLHGRGGERGVRVTIFAKMGCSRCVAKSNEFVAYQASARGGVVPVRLAGEGVCLGGKAVTFRRGELV